METLKLIGQPTCGISLTLHKVGGCIGGGRGLITCGNIAIFHYSRCSKP